ncbi:hypothetical protein Bca52824_088664 [Brassica carinata]|uniref:Uncharacterized protein n=1 Tax=Brassica carinata TaxID=52824 RepID=A0A8X7TR19_BRACI|nr:hypothetical protein Bca52824_088664 [Brassica carinata]
METPKPPDAAEAVAGEYPEMDFIGQGMESWGSFPDILTPLKSFIDPSNTGQQDSGGTTSLAGLVSTGFGVKTRSQLMKKLSKGCARKLGQETTFEVLFKMGKEAGEREYNARIQLCVENARRSNDAEYVLDQVGKAIEYLKEMRQGGFSIKEGTYGPFFRYLVDMEMVEEFQILKSSLGRQVLSLLRGLPTMRCFLDPKYHLVALCEKDRKENLQKVLEIVDITKVSSAEVLKSVFEYLGKSLLESVAMKLLWQLRDSGEVEAVSNLIFSYASCIPNSTVLNKC